MPEGTTQVTKILVVDDEPSILRSTQLLLMDMGFDVVTCADQSLVLEMLRQERPHPGAQPCEIRATYPT